MFWSQPKPWAKMSGRPSGRPVMVTLLRASTLIAASLAALPARLPFLGERADALGEVLRAERGLAERVELGHHGGVERGVEQRAQHALVAAHRQRRQGGHLGGERDAAR